MAGPASNLLRKLESSCPDPSLPDPPIMNMAKSIEAQNFFSSRAAATVLSLGLDKA